MKIINYHDTSFIDKVYYKKILKCLKGNKASQFKENLTKIGFVENEDFRHVFINKKKKIVVKFGGIVCGKKPKRAVPTIQLKKANRRIRIQPLVSVTEKDIQKALRVYERFSTSFGSDAHADNLGIYKGKAVTFDW